jgi:hypothetical protein
VTTIEITLPDALAEEAKGAGFLSPEAIEDLLRCKLASDRLKRLQQARDQLSARPEEAMTQEEIQAEIKAYRQEQRIAALRQHQLTWSSPGFVDSSHATLRVTLALI